MELRTERSGDDGPVERFGAWIASGVGGVTLLAAVVFATRWAVRGGLGDRPEVGVAIGLALGTTGLVAAEGLWGRRQGALAAGLAGSGLGILYFVLFAAHAWYGLLDASVAAAALLGVTAVGALQAVRRDSELMGALGLAGGMATPLLLGPHTDPYLAYLLVPNAAVALISLRKGWRVLPWLGIGITVVFGLASVIADGPPHTLVGALSAALLGAGYALLAAHRRVPAASGVPWLFGATAGLAVALPFLGVGHDLVEAVGLPLIAVATLCTLLRIAAERHPAAIRRPLLALVYGLGVVALAALAGRWILGGLATAWTAIALVVIPAAIARGAGWALDGDRLLGTVLWASALTGAVAVALLGDPTHGWAVALTIVATGFAISAGRGGSPDATGPVGAVAVLAASACLVPGGEPVPRALTGLAVFAIGLLGPLVLRPRATSVVGQLSAIASPVALIPLVVAWRQLTGDDWLGAVPLALGALSAAALVVAGRPTWGTDDERRLATSVAWALTVTFATLAVPMQLEAQWLTVGWAVEGAVLLVVASRDRSGWLAVLALGLLATVTVRLVANPAVLDYRRVHHARLLSWVWYGYGVPALALAASGRVGWVPAPLERDRVRLGLEVAAIAVGFCGLNLLVSYGFAGGDELLFDVADGARALRTVLWAVYAVGLLGLTGRALRPWWRAATGLGLLCAAVLKLGAWDLWVLGTLPSALALAGVASCAFVTAALLGRARPVLVAE